MTDWRGARHEFERKKKEKIGLLSGFVQGLVYDMGFGFGEKITKKRKWDRKEQGMQVERFSLELTFEEFSKITFLCKLRKSMS